ncbi:methyltransferase [Virgisporangium aliadipatigenens]|uniref:Methyltransferase n=1 Tax=Virgisporangium aliadipatigenens TaxID=741659 RepID=A0A8J4DV43_9ACTN|nr:class I SAM-dependent methyltransferase [Virgisporangium aliadipatigenens]GIJ51985.1 methyltransferase [Virgisporangium aliadipatigenens]
MAEILGDQKVQSEVLEGLAMCKNHRKWFVNFAVPYLGDHPVEVSAGTGDYAEEWRAHVPRMTVTEAEPDRIVALKERFSDDANMDVKELLLPATEPGDYSAAVSYNVLEHIDEDVDALRSMGELVRPGGHVIIVVPAFQWAMSPADIATGHVRRYTKKSMRAAMEAAGLEIVKLHYANTLGLFGYVFTTKILRLMPGPGKLVLVYDRFVAPLTRLAERIVTPPFGQSVVAIARVPQR